VRNGVGAYEIKGHHRISVMRAIESRLKTWCKDRWNDEAVMIAEEASMFHVYKELWKQIDAEAGGNDYDTMHRLCDSPNRKGVKRRDG